MNTTKFNLRQRAYKGVGGIGCDPIVEEHSERCAANQPRTRELLATGHKLSQAPMSQAPPPSLRRTSAMCADEKKAMIAILTASTDAGPVPREELEEFDEDHVADYFGGDIARADLFLAVLRFDGSPSGAQIADLARKHFHGDFDTARSFCALAAEIKVRVRKQEDLKAQEEVELAEIARKASAALQAKRAARAKQLLALEEDEPRRPTAAGSLNGPSSPGPPKFAVSAELGEVQAAGLIKSQSGTFKTFNTQSVQERVRQKEKQVQRTMNLLRALENAKFETDNGYVQLQGAIRPRSYTHEVLKGAGMKYRRGKPVFNSDSKRSASALAYYEEDDTAPRRYRAQGSKMAVVDRRARSATPGDHAGQKLSKLETSTESERARRSLRASSRPSTLAPLTGTSQTCAFTCSDSLAISLPVLCKLKSSETAALTEATRPRTAEELKQTQLDTDLDHDDPLMEEPKVIAQKRLQASRTDLAKGIALGVSTNSILLSTQSTRSMIEHHIITHNGEARDVMRRVENVLGDIFSIDIRHHGIPIRVTDMLPEVLNISVVQKSRLNAHLLECAPRAVCVKREISLPQGMGRHLHASAYYKREEGAAGVQGRVAKVATELANLRESITELSNKRRKHTDPLIREQAEAQFKAAVEAVEKKESELQGLRDQVNSSSAPKGSLGGVLLNSLSAPTVSLGGVKLPPMDHQRVQVDASVARAHQPVHRNVNEILALRGMSSYQLAGEVAKAIGSAFLFLEHYDGLDSHTEGAFCELCSYVLAREEKSQLMQKAGVIHEKIAELEGELKYTEEELKVLEQHVKEAHKEREEADEAELHAKHTVRVSTVLGR